MASTASPWFAVSMGLLGLIIGYSISSIANGGFAAVPTSLDQNPQVPNAPTLPTVPTGLPPTIGIGPTLGDSNAPVTIVEFTDFECPFCTRHFTETFGQIKSAYIDTGKVKYEVRNFPLTSIHPNAQAAAEASMCAHEQDGYWGMHDLLFQQQNAWSSMPDPLPTFRAYADQLELNENDFDDCMTNHDTASIVQKDLTDGATAGISGTPGFWIIGPDNQTQNISGAYPFTTFQEAVDGML